MKCLRQLLTVYVQAIVLALLLLNAQTASAKSPPFYWDFINVLIDVQENGDMLITETQKYVFTGSHTNERYRYIPLDKVDGIDQIEVYEGEDKRAVTTNIKNGQRWIKWRHELNPPESHTFVLKYRVKGGIQIHGEEDWVHVKAIFKDRAAPIKSGKVTVRLPDALAGKISSFKSFGVPAETVKSDGRTVEFVAQGAMPPGKELEVQVAVPHGVLDLGFKEYFLSKLRDPAFIDFAYKIAMGICLVVSFIFFVFIFFAIFIVGIIGLFVGVKGTLSEAGGGEELMMVFLSAFGIYLLCGVVGKPLYAFGGYLLDLSSSVDACSIFVIVSFSLAISLVLARVFSKADWSSGGGSSSGSSGSSYSGIGYTGGSSSGGGSSGGGGGGGFGGGGGG